MRVYFFSFIFLGFVASSGAADETGADLVRKHFSIDQDASLNEFAVRDAVLKIVPYGTEIEEVFARLEKRGVGYPKDGKSGFCSPDRTELVCFFHSPKSMGKQAENYTIEFWFDNNKALKHVEVRRWYRGVARIYTSDPTEPAKNIKLKLGLGVGSKVREFDSAYGEGGFFENLWGNADWPLAIEYVDKATKEKIIAGVEIGDISRSEVEALKNDRKRLAEYRVGIIFTCCKSN